MQSHETCENIVRNAKKTLKRAPKVDSVLGVQLRTLQTKSLFRLFGVRSPGAPAGFQKKTVSGNALSPADSGFSCSWRSSPFSLIVFLGGGCVRGRTHKKREQKQQSEEDEEDEAEEAEEEEEEEDETTK